MNSKNRRRRQAWKRIGALVAWWIVGGSLGWTTIQAAEPQKTPSQAAETKQPSAPVTIPAAEIIPRAEQASRSLQETRFQIAADSDAELNSLQAEIAAYAERSDRRWQGEAEMLPRLRSLQQLNDFLRQWSLEQSQLDGWDRALSRQSQILLNQEKEVTQIFDTWQATRDAGKQQRFPQVTMQKIAEVLREADAVRGLIRNSMATLLNLQIQLANRRDILNKIRNDIDKAREESGRQLFVLDSPPLWEALFQPAAKDTIIVQVVDSSQRFTEDLQEFAQKYRVRLIWHALFFLAMTLLFHFLRRDLSPESVERLGGASALLILDRPFASSCLLALVAVPLFYPGAAGTVLRIAALPTIIPAIRLLPRLLPRFFQRWIYLLLSMYVLDFFRYLLPAGGLLTRVLLLIIAAGACVGLGLFLRSRGTELSTTHYRDRLILLAMRLLFLLFAVSAISNIVGNINLAEIFVATSIRMIYVGALIFVGAHLLMTLSSVALQSRPAGWLRSVRNHGELIAFRCRALIRVVAVVFWVAVCLAIAGVLADISAAGAQFFQLRWRIGAAEISIQDIAVFCAVILSAAIFSRTLRFILTEEIFPRIRLPRGVPGAIDVLSHYGILLLGFFIALAAAGVDLSKVTLLISALGVGIGFGLQNVVNNFVSGLILVFEHPVQVGDSIEVGTIFGEVRKIGFRSCVLRTPDGADVVIPNGELVGAKFINWCLSDRLRRISISVGAAHGTDPDRVIEILLSVARKHPAVLIDPPPLAVFDRFADSALTFSLLCWSWVDNFFVTRGELTIAINNAFKEAGIQIPFPQQDVHVHWPDGQAAAVHGSEPSQDATKIDTERALLFTARRPVAPKRL
jgi:potassium efflux system protein